MNLIVLLPMAVFAVGALAIGLAFARVLDDAQQVRMEIERLRQVRPLLADVGTGTQRMRLAMAHLRRR